MKANVSNPFLYISSHQGPEGAGVYGARFDLATGAYGPCRKMAALERAGLMVRHPHKNCLYVVGVEGAPEANQGCIAAYAVDTETGALTLLNTLQTGAGLPTFITVSADGKWLFQVSFSSAAGSVVEITETGSLVRSGQVHTFSGAGPNPVRQTQARPHCMNIHPLEDVVFAADLGADQLVRFSLDRSRGVLVESGLWQPSVHPGAGPRILRFSDDGRHAYLLNELDSTLSVYSYNAALQTLEALQVISTLPAGADNSFTRQMAAEIRLHPNQQYVYASNRSTGEGTVDGMAVFKRDTASGELTALQQCPTGKHPRHFNLDPEGRWLLASARDADQVNRFSVDPATGQLRAEGEPIAFTQPWDVLFFAT